MTSTEKNEVHDLGVQMGKIHGAMQSSLLAAVMQGDAFRRLKALNALTADVIGRTGIDEIEIKQKIELADEFESLMHSGLGLRDTLDKLIKDGWFDILGHHALAQMGV